jgi:tetratricopeptide (TPR) repeat protein
MMDIFQVQSEIATQVAENLDITLLGSEQEAIEAISTENPDAYQAYLHGLKYFQRTGDLEENLLIAVEMFERAIGLDSTFALAYAALSRSHYHLYHLYYDHTEECISHAREAAERALELGPNLPESHLAMGRYHYTLKEYDKALEEYRIASKLRPNDSDVLGLGAVAMVLRRTPVSTG